MNNEAGKGLAGPELMEQEFAHLRGEWWWLFLFGVLLSICGAAAVIFPALTVLTTLVAVVVLGVLLIVAGTATIITSFWAGKWKGMMLHLLLGILYAAVGFMIIDRPLLKSVAALTLFVAAFFVIAGGFRIISSLVDRFPYWGWSLLNGIVTFLLGVIIYRLYDRFPESAVWILGLLIGLELLFHGWTWIMISLAIKRLPAKTA